MSNVRVKSNIVERFIIDYFEFGVNNDYTMIYLVETILEANAYRLIYLKGNNIYKIFYIFGQ